LNRFRIVCVVLAALVSVAACSQYIDDEKDKRVYRNIPTECFNGYRELISEIAGSEF